METRTLNADDLAELLVLYKHLHSEDSEIEKKLINDIWTQTLQSPNISYIGVFLENSLVSACQMVVVPNLTRGGLPYCLIENVVTHPDQQNKGYGKTLLAHATDLAWEQKCYKVMLMSGRKNESVLPFYKSAGFSADEKTAFVLRAECT